jgi:cytochrome c biogenesis protein CcmG/thiol:disulfide interchange protein DsbE
VALVLAAGTSCASSHPAAVGPNFGGGPTHAQLVATADLAPCPASSSTPSPGGLPNVTLACLGDGPGVHLAGLTGKPTVVNLWGSWCPPCQAEEGFLSKAYDKVRRNVRFLGVDTEDSNNSALDFVAHVKPPVRFPSVVDPRTTVLLDLHFQGPPETLYINSAGRIVHVHRSQYFSAAAVEADIATYLHVKA